MPHQNTFHSQAVSCAITPVGCLDTVKAKVRDVLRDTYNLFGVCVCATLKQHTVSVKAENHRLSLHKTKFSSGLIKKKRERLN